MAVCSLCGYSAKPRARAVLDQAVIKYKSRFHFARGYHALGEHDRVFDILADGIEDHDPSVLLVMRNPRVFAELRSDPRFDELLKQLGMKETNTAEFVVNQ